MLATATLPLPLPVAAAEVATWVALLRSEETVLEAQEQGMCYEAGVNNFIVLFPCSLFVAAPVYHGACMDIHETRLKKQHYFVCPRCSESATPEILTKGSFLALKERALNALNFKSTYCADTFCFCNQPDDGRLMVQCVGCDEWFHTTCVGEPSKGFGRKPTDVFACDRCTQGSGNLYTSEHTFRRCYDTRVILQCELHVPAGRDAAAIQRRAKKPRLSGSQSDRGFSSWQASTSQASQSLYQREFQPKYCKHAIKAMAGRRWQRATRLGYVDIAESHGTVPWTIACSPTQRVFAAGSDTGHVDLYQVHSAVVNDWEATGVLGMGVNRNTWIGSVSTSLGGISVVEWERSGEKMACGSWNEEGRIVYLDMVAGVELGSCDGHTQWVRSLQFSPTQPALLLSTSNDKTIRLWDVRQIMSARVEGIASVWEERNVQSVARCEGHTGKVAGAQFLEDDRLIVSAGSDAALRLWDTRFLSEPITTVVVAPSPSRASSSASQAESSSTLLPRAAADGRVTCLSNCAVGRAVTSIDRSPVSRLLAVNCEPNEMYIIDEAQLVSGTSPVQVRTVLRGHTNAAWGTGHARFSPDGLIVAAASEDGRVLWWDAYSGAMVKQLWLHSNSVWDLSWCNYGGDDLLVSCSEDLSFSIVGLRPESLEDKPKAGIHGKGEHARVGAVVGRDVLARRSDGKYYHAVVEEVIIGHTDNNLSRPSSAPLSHDDCCVVRFKGWGRGPEAHAVVSLALCYPDHSNAASTSSAGGINSMFQCAGALPNGGCRGGHELTEVTTHVQVSKLVNGMNSDGDIKIKKHTASLSVSAGGDSTGAAASRQRPATCTYALRVRGESSRSRRAHSGDVDVKTKHASQGGIWVQCDRRTCGKWRRLPCGVDASELPAIWFCEMNVWDEDHNSCAKPDMYPRSRRRRRRGRRRRKTTTSGGGSDTNSEDEWGSKWVQCDNKACRKWRRLPSHVEDGALPDHWTCSLNVWDPEHATCETAEENYSSEDEKQWVQCDRRACRKWRRLPPGLRASQLPSLWFCEMNDWNPAYADCAQPQEAMSEDEEEDEATLSSDDEDQEKWVQCEKCNKWRQLPSHVHHKDLPGVWHCALNTWDETEASCNVPERSAIYDSDTSLKYYSYHGRRGTEAEVPAAVRKSIRKRRPKVRVSL
eukprot:jgi/Chlat1/704/Chrsp104S01209